MRRFIKDGGVKLVEDESNLIPLLLSAGWTEVKTEKKEEKKNGNPTKSSN